MKLNTQKGAAVLQGEKANNSWTEPSAWQGTARVEQLTIFIGSLIYANPKRNL